MKRFTIDEVMAAVSDAFRKCDATTARDGVVMQTVRETLTHRTRLSLPEKEQRKRVASDEDNGE